jgi:hypothetical protein
MASVSALYQQQAFSAHKPLPDNALGVVKVEFQKSLKRVGECTLIFKGLKCFFNWSGQFSFSEKMTRQLGSSHSVIKLCSSTFAIPQLVNKSIQLYDDVKALGCCASQNNRDLDGLKSVAKATSHVFFSTLGVISKFAKVVYCLDKTDLINLTEVPDWFLSQLEKICFVAMLFSSSRTLVKSSRELVSAVRKYRQIDVAEGSSREEQKTRLIKKMALNVFKISSCTLVGISIFFPGVVSPLVALGFSTVSFGMGVSSFLSRKKHEAINSQVSASSNSIYYLPR